tara:strand:+ start:71 stop:382 length:312 start_codon:yes stop_codon:yes gene_type:complete
MTWQGARLDAALVVMMYDPSIAWSRPGENAHSLVVANAADSMFNVSGRLPGVHSANVVGVPIRAMLADPDGRDFRPKKGSQLDTMGAGAYTLGGEYWVPGPRR